MAKVRIQVRATLSLAVVLGQVFTEATGTNNSTLTLLNLLVRIVLVASQKQ